LVLTVWEFTLREGESAQGNVDLRTRKGKEEGENYTVGSLIILFTIKQTVYSDNNSTILYDTGILLRQYVSVILSPIVRPTCIKGTISAYYVLWDPIILTRCTRKHLRI